jgi:hypothetical protein
MILRTLSMPLAFAVLLSPGLAPKALADSGTGSPDSASTTAATLSTQEVQDMDAKVRDLRELFDRLELQAEQTKSQIDKAKPQAISFGSGELTLSNSMAWPVATSISGTAVPSTFSSTGGAQALLGFNLNPLPDVKGSVQIELLGPVAVDRLLPQQEVKLAANNQWAVLRNGEIKFEEDQFMARAFLAIPRSDLYEEGDMFYLFPAADDTNKYFRQSGRAVPDGFQFLAKEGWIKGFEVWAGDELVYGVDPMVFARYKQKLGPVDFSLMSQWTSDPTYSSGKNMDVNQEAWLRLPLFNGESLDLAAVHKPTAVGQSYSIAGHPVTAGQGTLGTDYLAESSTATDGDAWGGILRLRGQKDLPLLEEEQIMGEYSGPIAGNRMRISGLLSARPQRYLLVSLEAGWQQPIVGLVPSVIEGTPGVNFGLLPGTGPRPYGSPVTVSEDPISGQNNRAMTELTATLEFNPGQGWFYKYRPRLVQDWNYNTDLKTPFSSALSAHVFNYPTGTDLSSYIDSTGQRVAEPATRSGMLPSNGWLYQVSDITAVGIGDVRSWLYVSTGQQTSGLSWDSSIYPANTYFDSSLTTRYKAITLSLGYGEDVYGPDDWYQVFGEIIGNRYRASATYSFGSSDLSIKYEGWRDKDASLYHDPVNTVLTAEGTMIIQPPIDQVMTTYTIRF